MHIDLIQKKETKALLEQGELYYTQITGTEKMVVKAEQ